MLRGARLFSGVVRKIQASGIDFAGGGLLCWRRDAYAGFVEELEKWAVHFLLIPFMMMVRLDRGRRLGPLGRRREGFEGEGQGGGPQLKG